MGRPSAETVRGAAALTAALLVHAALVWLEGGLDTTAGARLSLIPSAGLAFAGAAIWGWRSVPGLLLGAWAAGAFQTDTTSAAQVVSTLLVASVGVWRIHSKHDADSFRLEDFRQIVFGLFPPVLMAAAASTMPMPWLVGGPGGTADAALALGLRFATVAVSLLLVSPIVFSLWGRPAGDWRPRRRWLVIPLALLLALLQLGLNAAAEADRQRSRARFEQRAHAVFEHLLRQVQEATNALDAMHGVMLATQGAPSVQRFDSLAATWLMAAPAVGELGWLKAVPPSKAAAVHDAGEASNAPEPASVEIHHVMSVQPPALATMRARLEVSRMPQWRAALLAALKGGPARATEVYRDGNGAASIAMIRPYRLDDGRLDGLVFVTLRIDAWLSAAQATRMAEATLCVAEARDDSVHRLEGDPSCGRTRPAAHIFEIDEPTEIGGTPWRLVLRQPATAAMRADGSWSAWLLALAAMPIATLFALLLVAISGHAQREARRRLLFESQAVVGEQDLRCVFETATVGLVQSGPDQLIINANPAFCELTGYTLPELRRMRIADFTPPQEHAADAQAWARLLAGGEDQVWRGEKHYLRRDGSVIPVSVRVRAVRDADGRLRYTVGSVQDTSESIRRQEAERVRTQAEAANQAKSAFVAQMSHELRTPLNAILGFSQLLAHTGSAHGPQAAAWLERIQQAGWHLLAMIDDLLDLSRIEAGVLDIQPGEVELNTMIDTCLAMVNDAAARRGIVLHNRVGREASAVQADPVRLRQVLINLLSNAVKYNRDGGEIRVHARRVGTNRVEVDIADTGLGMSEAQLEQLFRPFNRLGRERSGIEGTGIGLVIAKGLTELMGGSLRVLSSAGRGTTFTLVLPCAQDLAGPMAPAAEPPAAPAPYPARRVLYVEDNDINVEIMRAMLAQRPQILLSVAASAGEALAALARGAPDLILLHRHLPDMDGLTLLRRIRATPATSRLPVVVVSADATDTHAAQAIASGASGLLGKPFELSGLLAMVDRHLMFAATAASRHTRTPD